MASRDQTVVTTRYIGEGSPAWVLCAQATPAGGIAGVSQRNDTSALPFFASACPCRLVRLLRVQMPPCHKNGPRLSPNKLW